MTRRGLSGVSDLKGVIQRLHHLGILPWTQACKLMLALLCLVGPASDGARIPAQVHGNRTIIIIMNEELTCTPVVHGILS